MRKTLGGTKGVQMDSSPRSNPLPCDIIVSTCALPLGSTVQPDERFQVRQGVHFQSTERNRPLNGPRSSTHQNRLYCVPSVRGMGAECGWGLGSGWVVGCSTGNCPRASKPEGGHRTAKGMGRGMGARTG